MTWRLIHADCIEAMRELGEASVDAIVTDPPYGIRFMGKAWDGADIEAMFNKADRGARPFEKGRGGKPGKNGNSAFSNAAGKAGAYDFSLKGNAAFQEWCTAWATEALRVLKPGGHLLSFGGTRTYHRLACALEDADFEIRDCLAWLYGSGFPKSLNLTGEWQGWGTALKPAFEPIVLARKPLSGTVAQNVLQHGVGALNVDGTRIEGAKTPAPLRRGESQPWFTTADADNLGGDDALGRWPANVLLDADAAAALDEQSGEWGGSGGTFTKPASIYGGGQGMPLLGEPPVGYADSGGASRFFYTAKTSRSERENGQHYGDGRNNHPTVKPVDLMQWLCRLITPPGGLILDPFTGSGSTGIAALREGFSFIGSEREPDYVEIARARIIGDAPLFNVGAEA